MQYLDLNEESGDPIPEGSILIVREDIRSRWYLTLRVAQFPATILIMRQISGPGVCSR